MNIKVIKSRNNYRENKIKEGKKTSINFTILFLCFTFLVGIFLGSIYCKVKADNNLFEDSTYFVNETKDIDINEKDVLIDSLVKNLTVLILFWIVGLSIVGVPILIFYIVYEGFSVAIAIFYFLSMFGLNKGYYFAYSTMYITTFINTISIILLCNSAIRITKNILTQKSDIKAEFIRHSVVCLIILIFFIILSFNEVLVSNFINENNFT